MGIQLPKKTPRPVAAVRRRLQPRTQWSQHSGPNVDLTEGFTRLFQTRPGLKGERLGHLALKGEEEPTTLIHILYHLYMV